MAKKGINMKQLGRSDLYVNPIGLGCMGLSHAYGDAVSEEYAHDFLKKAFDYGYNFFDTAEVYKGTTENGSASNNEKLVGEAVQSFRDDIVIASKFGVAFSGNSLVSDSSPETIRRSIEGSLERLNLDYIDLYYQHRIDPKVEPETVAGEMQKLIDEGLIKAWGISNTDEEYLRRAHDACPVTAIQNRYSMLARWEEEMFPVCEELDITFVAFSPMANGFLSGIYSENSSFNEKDYRSFMPQYTKEGFESARELISLLNSIADEKDASASQISLAWMINKKDFIVPIPGTTSVENMHSNYDAGKIRLSASTIDEIDNLLDELDVPVFGGH